MPLFSRADTSAPPGWQPDLYATAAARARKRSEVELLDWADVALGSLGAALSEYRKTGDTDRLLDMRIGVHSMWAMLIELGIREEADKQLRS